MLAQENHGLQEEGCLGLVDSLESSIVRPAPKGSCSYLQVLLKKQFRQPDIFISELTLLCWSPCSVLRKMVHFLDTYANKSMEDGSGGEDILHFTKFR